VCCTCVRWLGGYKQGQLGEFVEEMQKGIKAVDKEQFDSVFGWRVEAGAMGFGDCGYGIWKKW